MKPSGISVLLALLCATFIHAAEPVTPPAAQAKFIISSDSIKRTFLCAEGVAAGEIEQGVVHADLHRAKDRYLLITWTEPTRSGSGTGGPCGAGEESTLIWLHVRGDRVIASRSALYDSCRNSACSTGGPEWTGHLFTVEYEARERGTGQLVKSKAVFDAETPEKGLAVTP